MSKKKKIVSCIGGAVFALVIVLATGFDIRTWQWWAIMLSSFLPHLSDFVE